ncbi:hypothetical protein [Lentzea sp. NEAU-D7]|uniref:hypothetical protein n=1 Tax=Lentzea sp. NEAU-D7 TaxID=2994667 RepID=UPI00224B168B|nr:hypothetical protein [Lentzea sp. NEAU-D7]MCX2947243.1 hypothetical protein [Lentzea sp. NEAU-D7]
MSDNWADKHWLNVPGPFYTGQTDNCWTGRLHAPRHILYGGDFYNEFVYRQPRTKAEIECVHVAAAQDPFGGYADDGNERWTPEAVRSWWGGRAQVEEHVTALLAEWAASSKQDEVEAADGARDFLSYLAGDLEADLRAYVFRLERGYYPGPGDRVPLL